MRTLLALCVALAPLLVVGLKPCPDGYEDLELNDNRCYMYVTEKKIWTYAFTSCQISADGQGNLLSVPDSSSFYPQYFQVRNASEDMWTGLLNVGGNPSWTDGTPYDHSIDQFIADDAGDDLYGYLSGDDGLFRFDSANAERGYACYVDLTLEPTTTTTPPPPPPCDTESGWTQYGDTCFLFSTEQQFWATAGHACHTLDAELISITDFNVLIFLLYTADKSTTYWTGLANEGDIYVWEDGSSNDTVIELLGPFMDDWTEGSDCVALASGAYPDAPPLQHTDCFTEQNYICYKAAATGDFYVPQNLHWL